MFKKAFGTFTEAVKASTAAFTDDQQTSSSTRNAQQSSHDQTVIPKPLSSVLSATTSSDPSAMNTRQNYVADVELDLSGLTEEEKAIIVSINARAAMVEERENKAKVDVQEESRRYSSLLKDPSTTRVESSFSDHSTTQKDNKKQVNELTKEERERVESVSNNANDGESTNFSIFGNKLLKTSPLGKIAEKLITNETTKETFKQLSNVKSDLEKNYGKMMEKAENLKKSDPTQDQLTKVSPSSSIHSGDFLEKFEEAGGEFSKKMAKKLNIGQNLHKFKESDVFAHATGAFDKFSHFVTDSTPPAVSQQQVDLSGLNDEEAAQILSVMAKADQLMDSQQQHQKSIFDENLREDAKKLTSFATKSSKEAFSFLKDSMSNIVDNALDVKAKSSGSKFDIPPTKDTKWFHESIQDDKEYQPEEPAVEITAKEGKQ
uniref:Uncharacterized protein n=1 Tax=Romanomermis culicivorax TaxID=13658 RepID=A0A915ILC9_ROMCU